MFSSNLFLVSSVVAFLIFCWQHIARKNGYKYKPSYILDTLTSYLIRLWTFLGKICVYLSSFYTWIDPNDIWATLKELFASVYHFLFSWTSFFQSYITNMKFYDHSYLISFGSATIVAIIAFLVSNNFTYFRPLFSYLPSGFTLIKN
ncbi:MAG: hypothetical protein Barrevirus12_11 [Barrevirus sp.]|uniref:Uncharacterized protein n=1 Tax=Barrevirus sp. TaxID=2487763 RepID=A0A3G4ZQC1_9VIRU|nr:MAG: hypothetical protein Barrevirus12_11 [Barrevirus sp.]